MTHEEFAQIRYEQAIDEYFKRNEFQPVTYVYENKMRFGIGDKYFWPLNSERLECCEQIEKLESFPSHLANVTHIATLYNVDRLRLRQLLIKILNTRIALSSENKLLSALVTSLYDDKKDKRTHFLTGQLAMFRRMLND